MTPDAPTHARPLRLPALAGWLLLTFAFAAIGALASAQAGAFNMQPHLATQPIDIGLETEANRGAHTRKFEYYGNT